ncbi:hypothetical protein L6Q96_14945 [Candidatus Binatia bacterium]|nr:hypothetical protein [Candidatus Binatia bacterium]
MTYAVVWPRAAKTVEPQPLAARLDTLAGKKIAFVWDYLFRGDEIFPLLEAGLRERFPGMTFFSYEEFGSTHGDQERQVLAELPAKLARLGAHAIISGMGC